MGSETGHILGEISEDEVRVGRQMLSALALNVGGSPGPGFFRLARDLGLLTSEEKAEERRFWEEQKAKLYDVGRAAQDIRQTAAVGAGCCA